MRFACFNVGGAVAVAGLQKYPKHINKEVAVSTLTGAGLKAAEKIGSLLARPCKLK
jgi:threonine synthase